MGAESCAVCGFVWDDVGERELNPRIRAGVSELAALLRHAPDVASERPSPARWSMLEYAGHVRDVLLHVRDRFVIGLVVDDPTFAPIYRDERVELGLYARDQPAVVADELERAADLMARTLDAISSEQFDRPCQYSFPAPTSRTLRWMGAQVVHEVEHHLRDVRENLTLVAD